MLTGEACYDRAGATYQFRHARLQDRPAAALQLGVAAEVPVVDPPRVPLASGVLEHAGPLVVLADAQSGAVHCCRAAASDRSDLGQRAALIVIELVPDEGELGSEYPGVPAGSRETAQFGHAAAAPSAAEAEPVRPIDAWPGGRR